MESKILKVPGASLYYEVSGSGPILLLIAGGNGDAGAFGPLARLMGERFTTVAYDRRGFSRSHLDDLAIVSEERLAVDVADVIALLDEVGRDSDNAGPAYIFGSSSGAIVALEVLGRHPERVRALVAHEPPLLGILPEADEIMPFLDEVYEIAQRDGIEAAMAAFAQRTGHGDGTLPDASTLPPEAAAMLARMATNQSFFVEYELRQYPGVIPDYARLQPETSKIVLAGGVESRDTLTYKPNLVLADRLADAVIELPGGHIGYVTDPVEFAAALDALLPDDGDGSPE